MAVTELSGPARAEERPWAERVPGAYWAAGLFLIVLPAFASDFVMFQIMGWTFILGIMVLKTIFGS